VAHRLEDRFRVVTYDQRGHGASSRASDYSPSSFLRDVEAVVVELALEDVVLVGHSLGGHLAVAYVADHPGCAGVVGVEGGVPLNLPAADWARMESGGRKAVESVVVAAMRLLRLGSSIPSERMKSLVDENDKWVRGLGAAYERISCPVMLVLGSETDRVPQGAEIREAVREEARVLQNAYRHVSVE
jgi:pimeloyl-ACP methyl ester carboxylesterase